MIKRRKNLGIAFTEGVKKVNLKDKGFRANLTEGWNEGLIPNYDPEFSQKNTEVNPLKITVIQIIFMVLFFVLFIRIFHLQIVEGRKNRELADGNRIQIKIIHAPRGVIYDRNGKILAANSPAFRLVDENNGKIRLVSREEALELEVKNDPRAESLEVDNVRNYPLGAKLAHALGYVGEISKELLENSQYRSYRAGDRIGQSGIEAQYEKYLRGKDGGEIVEVDSKGRKIRTLRRNAPIPGQNIHLTIDINLQEEVFRLLNELLQKESICCAAAVVEDPNNGQILALVSFPTFDPNYFTKYEFEDRIFEILNGENFPILDRVISGTYPPGSTYKIVTALAALDSGKIDPETTFIDNGVINLGTFRFTNWYYNQYGRTEGAVNLVKAIQRSNDIYFYEASLITDKEPIIYWSSKLFLGKLTGIDLPNETEGIIPDDDWKIKNYDTVWYPGDTLHMSIGQGFVLTTPLQILGITSFIASDGVLYKPQILQKIENNDFVVKYFKPQVLASNLIEKDKIDVIREGLELVPTSGGTAWPFFNFPISTAGKTGTAEYGDPDDRTHAWYTAYGPSDNPKIAMTVLIEGGGEGSSVAAPIVKETFRWYFSEDKNNLIKDVYISATDSGRTLGE